MLNEEQIEAKYHIVFVNKQRYYRESLVDKDFSLECTTPLSLSVKDKSFIDTSWKQLLIDVCTEFLEDLPWKKGALLRYRPSWTAKRPFSEEPGKNLYQVGEGIYLYCNQTAQHACWLLREVLQIFDVNLSQCDFIIHRCPSAEPLECRRFYEEKTKDTFRYYYVFLLKKSEEKAEQVIRNIEKLNRLLGFFSRSYDNFFLIDSNTVFSSYKSKFLDYLRYERRVDEKNIELADKYLTILGTFYKDIR